jgi:hypothetical protein
MRKLIAILALSPMLTSCAVGSGFALGSAVAVYSREAGTAAALTSEGEQQLFVKLEKLVKAEQIIENNKQ